MTPAETRAMFPEIAAIVDEIRSSGGTVTGMALYMDGELVAGRVPIDPVGEYSVDADAYIRMREYGNSRPPELPRMPEASSGNLKAAPKKTSITRRKK